jgi:microcystin degradation protein MlrC
MRLAALGFSHESNTYSPVHATLDRWLEAGVVEGDALVAEFKDAEATLSGYLELGAADPQVDVVPLAFYQLTPMNAITSEAFEHMSSHLIKTIADNGPFDGILLAQHGAAVSEGHRDADGEFIRRVREAVGPDVPIAVTLDMHANVSQKMVDNATVLNTYMTNPHLDPRKRARIATDVVAATIRGEVKPTSYIEMVPAAINILRQGTSDSPMKELVALANAEAERDGVLTVGLSEGFPYADVEEMGMSVTTVTDDNPDLAKAVSQRIARAIWDVRQDLIGEATDIDEALIAASKAEDHPVVLLDVGDNVGGGSPADSTHVLAAAQRLGITGVFHSLCDPEAVQACFDAGIGARVELDAGGKTDDLHGSPVPVKGVVRVLTDGKWEDPGDTHGGFRFFDSGPTALVACDDGNSVLLNSLPKGNTSRQQLLAVGIDPLKQPIIVAKGVHSPRGAFEPIAAEMVWLSTPGCTAADFASLEFHHRQIPMFPFEPDTTY